MSTTESLLRHSFVDSQRFSLPIYRAELAHPDEVLRVLAEAERAEAALLFIRCPCANIQIAQELERCGAVLMDTLVSYAARLDRSLPAGEPRAVVRAFEAGDLPVLRAGARAAFSGYAGHYHADARLEPAAATEGYVEWFERSTVDPKVRVLVAEWRGQPAGFLTLRRADASGAARIELNAVLPAAQGNGLYDALVKAALADCRAHREQRVQVSTQLSNIASQKVWVRNGFELEHAHYTFHYWLSGRR